MQPIVNRDFPGLAAAVRAVFAAPTPLKSLKPLTAAYNGIIEAYGQSKTLIQPGKCTVKLAA